MAIDAPSWLVEWLRSINLWDLILIACAVVAVIAFIRKKGWRSILATAKGILTLDRILIAVQGLPAWQERVEKKVDGIHHETHKNDGSSIKDSQDRTEAAVDRLERGMRGVYEQLADLRAADTRLEAADERLRADIENTFDPHKENPS